MGTLLKHAKAKKTDDVGLALRRTVSHYESSFVRDCDDPTVLSES